MEKAVGKVVLLDERPVVRRLFRPLFCLMWGPSPRSPRPRRSDSRSSRRRRWTRARSPLRSSLSASTTTRPSRRTAGPNFVPAVVQYHPETRPLKPPRRRSRYAPRSPHSVLRQKLAVTEIPVATVSATFKKHSFSYWIYGVDSKVFETEYRTCVLRATLGGWWGVEHRGWARVKARPPVERGLGDAGWAGAGGETVKIAFLTFDGTGVSGLNNNATCDKTNSSAGKPGCSTM